MNEQIPITITFGNGVGPELMDAVLRILNEAKADIKPEIIEIEEKFLPERIKKDITETILESIRKTKVFLMAPISYFPDGFENIVDILKVRLGINKSIFPLYFHNLFIGRKNIDEDIIIIYEHQNDFYSGIEYRQTKEVFHEIKLFSSSDSKKNIHYAFDFAIENNRKKITFLSDTRSKKLTNKVFYDKIAQVSELYKDISIEHLSIEKAIRYFFSNPDNFDIILIPKKYQKTFIDLIINTNSSNATYGIASFNEKFSIFESMQNSFSEIAGKNQANPSGLLIASILMLNYVQQHETATKIYNALLKTIEDGIHTPDIFKEGISKELVGTQEFANEVIKRLGQVPEGRTPAKEIYIKINKEILENENTELKENKELIGIDIYLDWEKGTSTDLGDMLKKIVTDNLRLEFISNKGKIVYPNELTQNSISDQWFCRYIRKDKTDMIKHTEIIELLNKIYDNGFDFIKIELLFNFDGKPGYQPI